MSDATTVAAAPRVDRFATAAAMSRYVARMGGRLAELLARARVPQTDALTQALDFLSAMQGAADGADGVPPDQLPLDRLATSLSLAPAEIDLILLAAMADEHEGYASLLRALHPRGEPCATAGLAAQIVCGDGRDRFALRATLEAGPAARLGLLSLSADGPFFERNLLLADGLWPVLCGVDVYPASLKPLAASPTTCGLDAWLERPDVAGARRAIADGGARVVFVVADAETTAVHRAAAIVAAAGRRAAAFEIPAAGQGAPERLALLHALAREAVPIFKLAPPDGPAPPSLSGFDGYPGPVVVCGRRPSDAGAGVPVAIVHATMLAPSARARMWRDLLPELADHAATLAVRYAVEPAVASDIACDLRASGRVDLDAVADSVRARCQAPSGAGVVVRRPSAGWAQLVLRPERRMLLVEALNRLVHQPTVLDRWRFLDGRPGARGVRLLFSGPPGTGKTLSAEVMAHALGVDLLVIDISRVVSKWIGETEKHLAQAFDAAERTRSVLLFDEADALFGKRTEVSDAHDRYANLETAYLLSRLEQFDGLVILSTNLKQNIDPAFLRRLEFVVDFDEPTAAEREVLWRCHLPPEAPLAADVDLRELAQLYPIVGGLIRNASVAAGFLAAEAGAPIGRAHLVGAIRREYDKSAKAFPGAPAGVLPA